MMQNYQRKNNNIFWTPDLSVLMNFWQTNQKMSICPMINNGPSLDVFSEMFFGPDMIY